MTLSRYWPLAAICFLYLVIVVSSSLMIPAWEANDEAHHVLYVQRILLHEQVPYIDASNGQEAHQPPLFYAAASLWQRALGIDLFEPGPDARRPGAFVAVNERLPTRTLMLSHDYDRQERRHALYVHALRVVSIAFGLGTVLLTYAGARLASGRDELALAAAGFVAFLPKFDVVSATFTNDSLVIALSSFLLVLVLTLVRGPPPWPAAYAAFGAGAVAGAAFITKLSAAVLIPVVVLSLLLAPQPLRRTALHLALAAIGFVLVAGWWFTRNEVLYGELLARGISREYLRGQLPGLIDPAPLWDAERFLYFLPDSLFRTAWYTGGWNQFIGPFAVNFALWLIAGVALFAWGRVLVGGSPASVWTIGSREAVCLTASALAGLAAVVLVARDTLQAEGRIAYVGLSAFAVVVVAGLEQAVGGSRRARTVALATFPALLLAYEVYVLARYVIPFRGL